MKIHVKNLGILKQAEFSLGEMTIICGSNNTGKTYATYALFGFLSLWREIFSINIEAEVLHQLLTEGTVRLDITQYFKRADQILSEGCNAYTKQLPMIFAAAPDHFKDTVFQLLLAPLELSAHGSFERKIGAANAELFMIAKAAGVSDLVITLLVEKEKVKIPGDAIKQIIGDALKDIIFGNLFPHPFIASTERTGAAIFRKELNFPRNRILEEISQTNKNLNPIELLFKVYQDYALPVKTNVEFTRRLEFIAKQTSYLVRRHPEVLENFTDLIGGRYVVNGNDELYYVPKGKQVRLSMDESSSAVRSLLDIGFYLRHLAQPGDILIVDEPELNLHPENQRRVARLFARIVNHGIKVFITTHSDYIIKELNTLIMLNQDHPNLKRIAEKEGYDPAEFLPCDKIKVYIAEEALLSLDSMQRRTRGHTLVPADIDPALGIEVHSFDTTIETMNRIQDEIIWGVE